MNVNRSKKVDESQVPQEAGFRAGESQSHQGKHVWLNPTKESMFGVQGDFRGNQEG